MKPEKIIAGLGNPGSRYKGTRHNVGYMVLAEWAKRHARGRASKRFSSEVLEVSFGGKNLLLLSPLTYMNLSGDAVSSAMRFYRLEPAELLVICDDVDLPTGRIRFRAEGGSGGQKGLKDVIAKIGTERFARLRVGIGRPPESMDTADYVLSTFSVSERGTMDEAIGRAADAVACWVENGPQETMNRYNG